MTQALELLNRIAGIGPTVLEAGDDRLILRAGPRPIPAALVRQLRELKVEIRAALAASDSKKPDRAWWTSYFYDRCFHWELSGWRPPVEAASLAFGDCVLEWRRQHGALQDSGHCAGCGNPVDGARALDLGRGARVHLDSQFSCLTRYGRAWRSAALAGLHVLGLEPPEGVTVL